MFDIQGIPVGQMIEYQQKLGRKCRTCGRTPKHYTGTIDDAGQCCACYCYMCSPYYENKDKCPGGRSILKYCRRCPHRNKKHAVGENPATANTN